MGSVSERNREKRYTLDDAMVPHPLWDDIAEYMLDIYSDILKADQTKAEGMTPNDEMEKGIDERLHHLWVDCDEIPAIPVETSYEDIIRKIKFAPVDRQGKFMVIIQTATDDEAPEIYQLFTLDEALNMADSECIGNEIELIEEFVERMDEALKALGEGIEQQGIQQRIGNELGLTNKQINHVLDGLIEREILEEFLDLIRKGNKRTRFESAWFHSYLEIYGEEMLDERKIMEAMRENAANYPDAFLAERYLCPVSDDEPEIVLPPQEMPDSNENLRALCIRAEISSIDSMELTLDQKLEIIQLQKKIKDEFESLAAKENHRTKEESDWYYYLQTVLEELESEDGEDLLIKLWDESQDIRTVALDGYYSIKELPNGLLLLRDGNACQLLNMRAAAKKLQADGVIEKLREELHRMKIESDSLKAQKRGMTRHQVRIGQLGRDMLLLQGKQEMLRRILARAAIAEAPDSALPS